MRVLGMVLRVLGMVLIYIHEDLPAILCQEMIAVMTDDLMCQAE